MKRKLWMLMVTGALVAGGCMLALTGCGEDERVITGDASDNTAGSPVAGDAGSGTTSENAEKADAGAAEAGGESAGEAGNTESEAKAYVFVYNGCTIAVDAGMEDVLEGLGEPASYYEVPSCAFDGMDKIYTYSGFEIDTYPKDDKDCVSVVLLKDDSVATPEGVYIGSSKDELLAAYGEDYSEEAGMLVYRRGGMKLCFIVTDDEVSSIQYFSTVLGD